MRSDEAISPCDVCRMRRRYGDNACKHCEDEDESWLKVMEENERMMAEERAMEGDYWDNIDPAFYEEYLGERPRPRRLEDCD